MKYAVIVYEIDDQFEARNDPARKDEYWKTWGAYSQFLGDRVSGGAALQGVETATTIRLRDGERKVQDGPFADTKERLGGFFLIEAADLDEAIRLANECPSAKTGSVEVRPVLPIG
ncbi:MAG: YciI family protein [Myxococcota bacterium]